MKQLAEIEIDDRDDVRVVHVTGELDLSNVADVGDALLVVPASLLGQVVDLGGVRHIDSAGVRMLFDVRRRLLQRRQELVLAVPERARIRDVLELVAVSATIPVFADLNKAIASVRGG